MRCSAGDNDAADCAACKAAGAIVKGPKPHTIADGLQGRLGDLTWPPVRDLVTEVVVVSEQEIVAAMQLIFERMKVKLMDNTEIPPCKMWPHCREALMVSDASNPCSYFSVEARNVPLCRGNCAIVIVVPVQAKYIMTHYCLDRSAFRTVCNQRSELKITLRNMQVVVEPSGAVALAAALSPALKESSYWGEIEHIGVILSGGNVDIAAKGFWKLWKA